MIEQPIDLGAAVPVSSAQADFALRFARVYVAGATRRFSAGLNGHASALWIGQRLYSAAVAKGQTPEAAAAEELQRQGWVE
jgi:hypothetical protein